MSIQYVLSVLCTALQNRPTDTWGIQNLAKIFHLWYSNSTVIEDNLIFRLKIYTLKYNTVKPYTIPTCHTILDSRRARVKLALFINRLKKKYSFLISSRSEKIDSPLTLWRLGLLHIGVIGQYGPLVKRKQSSNDQLMVCRFYKSM